VESLNPILLEKVLLMQVAVKENLKIAIMLRTLRGALDMTQAQLADLLGVPKATINRAESLRLPLKVNVFFELTKKMQEAGLEFDALTDEPTIKITTKFLDKQFELTKNT